MKILLAATDSHYANGAAKCLIELAHEYMDRGDEVVVSLPRHGDIETVLNEQKIKYLVIRERGGCWISAKMREKLYHSKRIVNFISAFFAAIYLKISGFDLVYMNALTAYVSAYAGLLAHIKVVWHIREFVEEDLGNIFLDREWSFDMVNKADRVIAVSKAVKDKWQPLITKDIEVVYDTVPKEKYTVLPSQKCINENKIRLLIYGRIMPSKGQLFCVKGFEKSRAFFNMDTELLIAGNIEKDSYFKQIDQYIKEHNLSDCVKYVGEISDIRELLKTVDITCVCSDMEAYGRVTLESSMALCRVLGSDSGGTRELIEDLKCGELYHAGDLDDFSKKLINMVNNCRNEEITTKAANVVDNLPKRRNVAIMTWVRNCNFGTTLQSLALYRYLCDLGNDVTLMDYDGFGDVIQPTDYSSKVTKIHKRIRTFYEDYTGRWNMHNEYFGWFGKFLNSHMKLSKPIGNGDELKGELAKFDATVIGSDQVWSPLFFNPYFYGDAVADKNRVIPYAPSFGVANIKNPEIRSMIGDRLAQLPNLSVREKTGAELIKNEFNLDAEVLPDPVFLMDEDYWREIASESTMDVSGNYLLVYFLGNNSTHFSYAKRLAGQMGLELIIIPVQRIHTKRKNNINCPISPADFLKLILNADYICTDSFHGTAFSIIFKKQFTCFKRFNVTDERNQNNRVMDLLEQFNLLERMADNNITQSKNDSLIDLVINEDRIKAKRYLSKTLAHIEV